MNVLCRASGLARHLHASVSFQYDKHGKIMAYKLMKKIRNSRRLVYHTYPYMKGGNIIHTELASSGINLYHPDFFPQSARGRLQTLKQGIYW